VTTAKDRPPEPALAADSPAPRRLVDLTHVLTDGFRLLTNRDVRCLGVDSLTLDPTNSIEFPVHRLLLGEDRLGLEILTHLEKLPSVGATVVIGVVPFEKGSGAPGRIFALV
jgi:kynurenine formamidase